MAFNAGGYPITSGVHDNCSVCAKDQWDEATLRENPDAVTTKMGELL